MVVFFPLQARHIFLFVPNAPCACFLFVFNATDFYSHITYSGGLLTHRAQLIFVPNIIRLRRFLLVC